MEGTLAAVAPIVIRACAMAGCHDAVTHEHGMNLSTAELIYASWVGQLGLDHCGLREVPRVVPGDPEASFVMTKVRGLTTCDLSMRMPPPPAAMLADCEIETLRLWIAAGAPGAGAIDGGGGDALGDAVDDAGTGTDAYDPDADLSVCSSTKLCEPLAEICIDVGGPSPPGVESCGSRWECASHFSEDDGTLEHACPAETAEFCGCDGTTFVRPYACPDRPYDHIGACADGFSCNPERVTCADPKPVCPDGQLPAVATGCWGPCIPVDLCRCQFSWQCGDTSKYRCRALPDFRCEPIPPDPDAGVDAPDASIAGGSRVRTPGRRTDPPAAGRRRRRLA